MDTTNCIIALSAIVTALATVAIGYFSYRTVELTRSNGEVARQLAWFTGAMESHSDLQLRIAAKAAGIEVFWWDPTLEPWPTAAKHGEKVQLSEIYVGMPRELRAGKAKSET